MLTAQRLRDLLSYDPKTGEFHWRATASGRRLNLLAGTKQSGGYLKIGIDLKAYLAHRLAFLYMTGEWPPEEVDHINGDRADNRWSNLRPASSLLNKQNTHRAKRCSTTGLIGAFSRGSRFFSNIRINGKRLGLGTFDTAQEAHEAYISAKRIRDKGIAP